MYQPEKDDLVCDFQGRYGCIQKIDLPKKRVLIGYDDPEGKWINCNGVKIRYEWLPISGVYLCYTDKEKGINGFQAYEI